jgi:hypothetical protein
MEVGQGKWIPVLGVVIILMASPSLSADSSRCYSIKDRDRQHFCLATAKHDPSYCYSIQNRSVQHFCLSIVKNNKTYCYSIQEMDLQNQCLALF